MSFNWFLLNVIEILDNIVLVIKVKISYNLIYILKFIYNLVYKINLKRFILILKKCVIKGEMIKN